MPRSKRVLPPVETTIVRGTQPPKPSLVQSVRFTHLNGDGGVTTDSILDLATRPYSNADTPHLDVAENVGFSDFFDPSAISPPETSGSSTNENTTDTAAAETCFSAELIPSFFEIDPEDQVVDTTTGERRAPKRPHQVCSILFSPISLRTTLEEGLNTRIYETSARI
jgi:hypothetical protein